MDVSGRIVRGVRRWSRSALERGSKTLVARDSEADLDQCQTWRDLRRWWWMS